MSAPKIRFFDVVVIAFLITGFVAAFYMLEPFDRHRLRVFGVYTMVGFLVGFVQTRRMPWRFDRAFITCYAGAWCGLSGSIFYVAVFLLDGWPEPLGLVGAAVGGLALVWLAS